MGLPKAIRNHRSPFGRDIFFPANMWTINKFDILADIGRPILRRIESFGTIGKNPGFSYKPVICRKNPGFSPKSRVNPGFALEPEKFLGFRRLGYIYIYSIWIDCIFCYRNWIVAKNLMCDWFRCFSCMVVNCLKVAYGAHLLDATRY